MYERKLYYYEFYDKISFIHYKNCANLNDQII